MKVAIGLDGFSQMLLQRPETKNIQDLYHKQGAKLKSTMPPITGPAFGSFQTGKAPGKHGIGSLIKIIESEDNFSIGEFSGDDLQSETFYEALDDAGYNCFIMNLPYTYPARINGDLVTSWLTRSNDLKDFIYPNGLIDDYPTLSEYSPFPKKGTINQFLSSSLEIEENRINILKEVVSERDHDFIFGLISSTDWMQHRIFTELENSSGGKTEKIASKILSGIDCFIGWLLEELDLTEDSLMIFSDHGFKMYDGFLSINTLLEENGLLSYSSDGEKFMKNRTDGEASSTVNIGKLYNIVRSNTLLRRVATPVYEKLLNRGIEVVGEKGIDLEDSIAYCRHDEEFSLYVDDGYIPEVNNLLSSTAELDSYITDELHGDSINMGDVLVFSDKYRVIRGDGAPIKESSPNPYHSRFGMIATAGADFDDTPSNGSLLDLAPTILHQFGLEIPDDLDGGVQLDWLNTDSLDQQVEYRSPKAPNISGHSNSGDGIVSERLSDLGYL